MNPYIRRIQYAKERKPISRKRQKELQKQFPADKPIDIGSNYEGLTKEEQTFVVISRLLNNDYAKKMSIVDFLHHGYQNKL